MEDDSMTIICSNCILTDKIPNISFDNRGVCNFCQEYEKNKIIIEEDRTNKRNEWASELERVIETTRGKEDYDCVLQFSGGKDSCNLLYTLITKYKLKVLAFTNSFYIQPFVLENIKEIVAKLNVDHITYHPNNEFYKRFISHILLNHDERGAVFSITTHFWQHLRDGDCIRLATEKKIPLVFTGYDPYEMDSSGQPFEMPQHFIEETDWTPKELFDNVE